MLSTSERNLSCGSCSLDVGNFGKASSIFIATSAWADLSSSDEESLVLIRDTRTSSGGPTKMPIDDFKVGGTSCDILATKMSPDMNSDEDGFEPSHTTRASSEGSTMTGLSSEEDGIPCDVTTQRSFSTIPTDFDESQMVLKNTFLHISDEVDEEMPKDIRRVQSCPDRLDCSVVSLHDYGSELPALKSSWQYLRGRVERLEHSFRTRLALASLKERRRLPKRTQYKKKLEGIHGFEYKRDDRQASEHAQININTEKTFSSDRRKRGERCVSRAHGIVSKRSVPSSEDTEVQIGKKRDPVNQVQSSVVSDRQDMASMLSNAMGSNVVENEQWLFYLEGKFSQHNKGRNMQIRETRVSGHIEVTNELGNKAQDNEARSAQAPSATVVEHHADGTLVEVAPSSTLSSDGLIANDDAASHIDKLDDVCDGDDGSQRTKIPSRPEREVSCKHAQTTKKHRLPKAKQPQQRQRQGSGTNTSCKPMQLSLRKSFRVIVEKTGPFTVLCFLIVFIVILGKIGVETNFPAQAKGCFRGKIPSYINVTSEPREPDVMDILPRVTLYAPCLLNSYEKIAGHYTVSASAWNYVESQGSSKIEVRNYREEPSVMWKKVGKTSAIEEFLIDAMVPQVGKLTEFTSQFYGSLGLREQGLIIGLFEPGLEEEELNDKYRPMLAEVAHAMQGRYQVTYMNTKKNHVWAESQFGAVSFPAIAINDEFPGKTVLYTGDMSAPAVLQFLRDFGSCVRRSGRDQMRALMGYTESPNDVCEAPPVLRA